MTSDTVETFIKIIKENSTYSKCIERNIIEKIIDFFMKKTL